MRFLNSTSLTLPNSNPRPKFIIGVDTYDENALTYCLARQFNGNLEIIMQKTIRSKEDFDAEVENIVKYFDAEKTTEND